MAEKASKLPVKVDKSVPSWRPLANLRRKVDRLFDEFDRAVWESSLRIPMFDLEPLWGRDSTQGAVPAVDVAETETAYEIAAELAGVDPRHIDVKLADGGLIISGRKLQGSEEKHRNYYVNERRFGSFERFFRLPYDIDADKIEATFRKGVLTVTLPKSADAHRLQKKIGVKIDS